MNFELGKQYIVKVSEKGIVPTEEFDSDRFYDKDSNDLDFLTDEEKIIVINEVLDKIKAEVNGKIVKRPWLDFKDRERDRNDAFLEVLDIIDKYKAESEE